MVLGGEWDTGTLACALSDGFGGVSLASPSARRVAFKLGASLGLVKSMPGALTVFRDKCCPRTQSLDDKPRRNPGQIHVEARSAGS